MIQLKADYYLWNPGPSLEFSNRWCGSEVKDGRLRPIDRRMLLSEAVGASPIRVYLMIENRLLREALGRLFRKRPDLQVVGQSDHNGPLLEESLAEG